MKYAILVTCPKALENLLEKELITLGMLETKQTVGGIYGIADQKILLKICLWSRLANRVLLLLVSEKVTSKNDCYQQTYDINWPEVFSSEYTFSVKFKGKLPDINNEVFGAKLIKDAVADRFRQDTGQRPNVAAKDAKCQIRAKVHRGKLQVFLDLSGHSLHQRGYRQSHGKAPLKENLAAAMLIYSGFDKATAETAYLIDPFCGSATILIEAAMMLLEQAPALSVEYFGFMSWKQYNANLWQDLKQQAEKIFLQNNEKYSFKLYGFDKDMQVLKKARQNIADAKLSNFIELQPQDILNHQWSNLNDEKTAFVVTNPPYGERLNDMPNLVPLYQKLGEALHAKEEVSTAVVLTSDRILAKAIGLRSHKQYQFLNANIPCQLFLFDLNTQNKLTVSENNLSKSREMILNRLKKNYKNLQKWLTQNNITCYRLYDADIPEYAFAIDVYENIVHVQEYMAPKEIPLEKTQKRLLDILYVLPRVLDINPEQIVLKQRQQQKGKSQYERQAQTKDFFQVSEGSAKFWVNCRDYLDTGLFLDHRLLRHQLRELARNKRVLNLFCYTATASVHAALGGAKSTVSVDMSNTYLKWAKRNFLLNGLNLKYHTLVQADCLKWLSEATQSFDLIFLDPPSFSNSKRMDSVLDVQRDHVSLIINALKCLAPGGILFFSTNYKKFKFNLPLLPDLIVQEITDKTIDKDFARRPNIHRVFEIIRRTND